MPADVELARREGIELVKTGSWDALTGSWNPTPEDLAAAVEAQHCPAIRKPILKLGHQDPRFDGEPALGWFEQLRLADNGHTLVADQVALPWLHSVQAAAYPSRSVEGNYRHRCSEGHTHRFVLTAVALLGVTPPAVKTIRNLNDLPAMLGVAAGEPEVPDGAEHVQVTILAGRHSFDESKHARDGDGKFTSSPGGGAGGSAETKGPASGLKHNPKVAARIPLADGETYAGSAAIRSAGIAVAAVDGPNGRTVRLGVGIDPDEIGRWAGANRGSTIVLDQDGMDQLREAIPQMLEAGRQGKARWRQMDRDIDRLEVAGDQDALDAHNEAMTEFGDFSVLDEGAIAGAWGDLHLRVLMSSGEPRYEMHVKAGTSPPVVTDELLEASHLRRLAKLLEQAGAAVPVQAADSEALMSDVDLVFAAWVGTGPDEQVWAQQVSADAVTVVDDRDGSVWRHPVTWDGDTPLVGDAEPAEVLVFASRADVMAHMPGKHNQGAHGNRFNTPRDRSSGVRREGKARGDGSERKSNGRPASEGKPSPSSKPDAGESRAPGKETSKPGLSERSSKAYDSLLDPDSGVQNKQARQILEQMEEHGWELTSGDSQTGLTRWKAPDGREIGVQLFGRNSKPRFTDTNGRVDLTGKAALQRVVTPDLKEAPGPAVYTALKRVDPALAERFIKDSGSGLGSDLRALNQISRAHLAPYGGEKKSTAEAVADLRREAARRREFAEAAKKSNDEFGTQDGRIRLAENAAEVFEKVASEMEAIAKERAAYEAERDRRADLPLDIKPGRSGRAKQGKPGRARTKVAASGLAWDDLTELEPMAAEPGYFTYHEEDPVSLSDDMRSRLGLADDATQDDILAAIDALKAKADTPAQPDPEMVAASAAAAEQAAKAEAEKDELRKEVTVLASQMEQVTTELAAVKAEKAATVKASVLDAAIRDGKIKPADRDQWSSDYDEAPAAITRVLASIAVGTAVPVAASGTIGDPEPAGSSFDDAEYARLFGTTQEV